MVGVLQESLPRTVVFEKKRKKNTIRDTNDGHCLT